MPLFFVFFFSFSPLSGLSLPALSVEIFQTGQHLSGLTCCDAITWSPLLSSKLLDQSTQINAQNFYILIVYISLHIKKKYLSNIY